MTEIDNIDKLIKEKLASYTEDPPAEAWGNIKQRIPQTTGITYHFGKRTIRYAATVAAAALIIATYFVLQPTDIKQEPAYQTSEIITPSEVTAPKEETILQAPEHRAEERSIHTPSTRQIPPEIISPAITTETESQQAAEIQEKMLATSEAQSNQLSPHEKHIKLIPLPEAPVVVKAPKPETTEKIHAVHTEKPEEEVVIAEAKVLVKEITPEETEIIAEPALIREEAGIAVVSEHSSDESGLLTPLMPVSPYTIAVLGGRDRIYNTEKALGSSLAADLRLAYHRRDFFIESGLGVDYSADKWNYTYNFLHREALGTYTRVDSIYFTAFIDSTGNVSYAPNFVTSNHTVFDSVAGSDQTIANDYYTYLHIPLLAGYQLYRFRNIEVNIKGGPVVGFLINQRQYNPDLYPGDVRILTVNSNRKTRLSTNWYMLIACEMGYTLNKRLSLSLEPTVRYFKDPFYNSPAITDKPWSAGLRFGLKYGLGQN